MARKPKTLTLDQAEAKRLKAVSFLENVVGDYDRASEFADMTAEGYAAHRGLEIVGNPAIHQTRRLREMADSKADLKAEIEELEGVIEQVSDLVDEALDPVLTREQVIEKLQAIDDLVSGEEDEEPDEDEDDDS